MKRFMTFAASLVMAIAMITAPDMVAQSRTRGNGTATRSTQSSSTRSSSGSATRSSGSSGTSARAAGSSSSNRSSAAASQQDNRRRNDSGTATRSSGSTANRSAGSSSSSRSGSTASQQDNRRRNNNNGSATRSSGSNTNRSSGSSASSTRSSGSSATRSSGSSTRSSSGTSTRSSGASSANRSSGSAQQDNRSKGSGTRAGSSAATGGNVRATNANRGGLSGTQENNAPQQHEQPYRDNGFNYRYNDEFRVDDHHEMYRVAPRMRDAMGWDHAGFFWSDHPHYYGYRIHTLPPEWRHINHWGIDYYYYNGIYYRPYGGAYVICRPPFGTPLEVAIDRAIMRVIRFAYYCDTYRTYNTVFDNYNVIARQNLIIAQNNARIAAANAQYALNTNRALSAYELANMLGLVQSYAYANAEYFYQDGVFYTISASGTFSTIVPPAGALVTSLPDDYEVIVMNGVEYYMVDNTVYRTTVFEGEPFLEVLGQMYGSLYNQYNIYR